MQAIRVHRTGGPEVLTLEEMAVPQPGPGQVLVKLEAVGVNFIDIYQRSGLYNMELPYTPGSEAAGVVVDTGAGVTEVRSGDRIAYALVPSAYAQYAVVPEASAIVIPSGLSAQKAAAVLLQGMTAHYLADSTYPLKPGDTCLVHAAAGGVGLLLCQIAHRRGARVLATVSTEAKAELARGAGADETILYTRQDFPEEIARLTGGGGVQVVYDSVGQITFAGSLRCLAPRGLLVLYGQSSGPVPPLDAQILAQGGSLFLTRPTLHHYVATRAELLRRAGEILEWLADGSLNVRLGCELPLAQAAEAHRRLAARETTGKVLLLP